VLKKQPVVLDILFLLGREAQNNNTGLHVNKIYSKLVDDNKIRKNKQPVVDALRYLKEGGLIESNKCEEHEQKEIKTLTPLGHEFVKLANDLDKYIKSCSDLQEALLDIIGFHTGNISDKKIQRSILHNKGWTAEEIDESEKILESSLSIMNLISPYEIISVMLMRYISVLSTVSDNEKAKTILNNIMMDKINDQLSKMIDQHPIATDISYENLISQKIGFVKEQVEYYYHFNRFTDPKVSNVISSLSDVLLTKDYEVPELTSLIKLLTHPDKEFEREVRNKRIRLDPSNFYNYTKEKSS
jgi:DNA-binding PadR family transcriptional regulator